MTRISALVFLASAISFLALVTPASASIHSLSPSLAPDILSESVPLAFAPNDFTGDDFVIEWVGSAPEGVSVTLLSNGFEWVRVAEVLVLPRGRLRVVIDDATAGVVTHAGFTQHFVLDEASGRLEAQVPVALLSSEKNQIQVSFNRKGKIVQSSLRVRFSPRKKYPETKVYTDPSCSPFDVQAVQAELKDDSWALVGCRLVAAQGEEHRTSSLELFVFWDNAGEVIEVEGFPTTSTSVSVWPLRMRSKPGKVTLKSAGQALTLRYHTAERFNFGFIGAGIGPYVYTFTSPEKGVNTIAPLLTLYGSYFFSEGLRLVAFDAMPISRTFYTDFGVYLNMEYFLGLDRRFLMNLMLGGHMIAFKSLGDMRFQIGAPQGVEFIFRDFLGKNRNLAAGAFAQPKINEKVYYNLWLRWGSPALFGEFNYIALQENLGDHLVYSRSVGFSLGFPLARFF